eukprot:11400291-Karenia_brevis.AAC.1
MGQARQPKIEVDVFSCLHGSPAYFDGIIIVILNASRKLGSPRSCIASIDDDGKVPNKSRFAQKPEHIGSVEI